MNIDDYNVKQYNRMLAKYGKTVTDAYTGVEYKVIFHKQNAKNMQEKIKISYQQDYPLKKGSIIKYKDMYFLIISRDRFESEAYHSSIALKCQSKWSIKGSMYYLVTGDLSSPNPKNGSVANTINGNICLYTKESKMIEINDYVVDFDGWYKCVNTFTVDGMSFYYFQRSLEDIDNTGSVIALSSKRDFNLEDEQASLTCYYKGVTKSGGNNVYLPDAEIEYSSSDTEKATVDENGIVTFKSSGTVTITASYGETTLEMNITISGTQEPATLTWTVTEDFGSSVYTKNTYPITFTIAPSVPTDKVPVFKTVFNDKQYADSAIENYLTWVDKGIYSWSAKNLQSIFVGYDLYIRAYVDDVIVATSNTIHIYQG